MTPIQRTPGAQKMDRRRFLGNAASIGMSAWVAGRGAWADESSPQISPSKNERLAFACIGVGGKGDGDCLHVSRFGDVVALCDIDDRLLDRKSRQSGFERAERFNDYR